MVIERNDAVKARTGNGLLEAEWLLDVHGRDWMSMAENGGEHGQRQFKRAPRCCDGAMVGHDGK